MIKSDFADLTNRPHTLKKLFILKNYLSAWADIILGNWRNHPDWAAYRTPYYIDCFAFRGKFHKDGKNDSVNGSPLIGLEIAKEKQTYYKTKYDLDIQLNCIFVEHKKKYFKQLKEFCKPYDGIVNYELYNCDVNDIIAEIIKKTGYSPTFFLVDPGGIKELKKETVYAIATKEGGKDIMLNYIAGGPKRIGGLVKSIEKGTFKGELSEKHFKTINTLQEFSGLSILDNLDKSEKDQLREWISAILEVSNKTADKKNQLETIIYDMKSPNRSDNIYYLLFASRKSVARNIMKRVFKEAKKVDYSGQISMFPDSDI